MIFSRMTAGVDQSMRRSTRNPRLNQDRTRTDARNRGQPRRGRNGARGHQANALASARDRGSRPREIEPADQALAARLRGFQHLVGVVVGGVLSVGLAGFFQPRLVGPEGMRKRFEKRDALAGLQRAIDVENFRGERDPGGFAAPVKSSSQSSVRFSARSSPETRRVRAFDRRSRLRSEMVCNKSPRNRFTATSVSSVKTEDNKRYSGKTLRSPVFSVNILVYKKLCCVCEGSCGNRSVLAQSYREEAGMRGEIKPGLRETLENDIVSGRLRPASGSTRPILPGASASRAPRSARR